MARKTETPFERFIGRVNKDLVRCEAEEEFNQNAADQAARDGQHEFRDHFENRAFKVGIKIDRISYGLAANDPRKARRTRKERQIERGLIRSVKLAEMALASAPKGSKAAYEVKLIEARAKLDSHRKTMIETVPASVTRPQKLTKKQLADRIEKKTGQPVAKNLKKTELETIWKKLAA